MRLFPEEKADSATTHAALDWWEYWINIHIPALRRWTYPLIEGRPLEAAARRATFNFAPTNGDTCQNRN